MNRQSSLDLLLIHTPKLNNFYNPFGYFVMNNVVSWGTYSIADWADQSGYRSQILHLGSEILFNKGFKLGDVIRRERPSLIGMSCHWHYQLHDVLRLAQLIKAVSSEVRIVLGGYTATLSAEQILSTQSAVDFVTRGDSEVPVVSLLKELNSRGSMADVPNLSYRREGDVIHNPLSFTADKTFLENLTFCRLDLFPDFRNYLKYLSYPIYLRSYPKFFNYSFLSTGRLEGYMVPVGRGCPVNCSYCGGGNEAASDNFGRTGTTLISPERVLDDLTRAAEFGVESLYFPFDPYPKSDYFPRLFRMIRKANLKFDATFESFSLPTPEFIEEFAATFGTGKRNQILLSPETGDEAFRAQCKGYPYSNQELFETLDQIAKAGPTVQISYSIGLPGETNDTLEQTLRLWKEIEQKYKNVILQTATIIDPDPASPAERNNMVPAYTFESLMHVHRRSHKHSYTGWSYLPIRHTCCDLASNPDESYKKLRKFKCRHFCSYMSTFKIVSPFNRILCVLLGIFFRCFRRPLRLEEYV